MESRQYLDRIGYQGPAEPTRETLDRLIALHLANVPFENLDIVRLRRPIVLDNQRHFDKVVGERRGGFCYELNGLFSGLLEALGFGVTRGYAVWPSSAGGWVAPFEHLLLAVSLPDAEQPLLVDVGFGADCPVIAIPLRDGRTHAVEHREIAAYRASALPVGPNRWRIESKRRDGDWALVYEVDMTPQPLDAFAAQCLQLQTSPESHFTQALLCSRPLANGRVTLGGGNFILTTEGNRVERPLAGYEDELDLLRQWFDIEIDPKRYGGHG